MPQTGGGAHVDGVTHAKVSAGEAVHCHKGPVETRHEWKDVLDADGF